jgi:hypothetical protein
MTAFDDLDIWAPFDDDVDDILYTPRHMKTKQRKPIMKTLIRTTATLLVTVALAYATLWLTWQFALLINTVTTQVWN